MSAGPASPGPEGEQTAGAGAPVVPSSRPPTARAPRRARLVLRRVDPFSTLRLSLVLGAALLLVLLVAAAVLYLVVDRMGVVDSANEVLLSVTSDDGEGGFEIDLSLLRVLATTAVLGGVNVLVGAALLTLAAVLYNLCSDLVGGLEVTLTER